MDNSSLVNDLKLMYYGQMLKDLVASERKKAEEFKDGYMSLYKEYKDLLDLDGKELGTDEVIDDQIILDTITWTSTHTREGKISPGSTGYFTFELDPTGSEVAILYEIEFVDKVMDDDKIITFTNISSDHTLTRTAASTYSGIITLNDINNSDKTLITVSFEFDGDEDIVGDAIPNQVYEDLFEVNFHAVQYQGETLTAYTG